MKNESKTAVIWPLVIALLLLIYTNNQTLNRLRDAGNTDVVRDTITVVDTIRYHLPIARDSVVVRYNVVRLSVAPDTNVACKKQLPDSEYITVQNDFLCKQDSADVEIPITQTVYEDSTYRAYVSGFNARLDSLIQFSRNDIITVNRKESKPQRKWNVGIQAGYGITPKGLQPYVGGGVTFILY